MEETAGVHVWLVLGKAFHAMAARCSPGRAAGNLPGAGCHARASATMVVRCLEESKSFECSGSPVPPCHFSGTCSACWQLANNLTDHFHYIAESTRELLLRCEEVRVQVAWRGTTKLAAIVSASSYYNRFLGVSNVQKLSRRKVRFKHTDDRGPSYIPAKAQENARRIARDNDRYIGGSLSL
jgi:hypothetical protein